MADWSTTQAVLSQAVESGAVPAVVAGVTTRDGVAFEAAFGGANGPAATFGSVFWIASMTKAITSVAALQLVERGALDLEAPIGDVVPRFANPMVLDGFAEDGTARLRPARRPVTLATLLAHTSGLAENVWSADILRLVEATGMPTGASGKLAALDLPLLFEPGEAWQYGIGHDWVAQAIEAASGERLDAYFSRHLFEPMGMTDSTYFPGVEQRARLVRLHARDADGRLTPSERAQPPAREFISGGGTMYSTAPDYLAFVRMLLRDGEVGGLRILRPETVAAMAENRTGALPVSRLFPTIPSASNAVEMLPGIAKCWGLGTMVNLADVPGRRRAGSLAWAGLGNTYFWADRRSGIGGVLMTQILPFADSAVLALLDSFEAAVYEALGDGA